MAKKKYSAAEIQKMFHINRSTLRYYMDRGLVGAEKNEENGYLSFDKNDMDDLNDVYYLRQVLDFSTKEIEGYMKAESLSDYYSIFFMHKEILKREIEKRQKQLHLLTVMENDFRFFFENQDSIGVVHFENSAPVLVPVSGGKTQDHPFSVETISDEDLYWYCNIFRANEAGQYVHSGFGYYVEPLSDHAIDYDPDLYEYKELPPGDYLYGMGSVAGNYADPSVMEPFLDYAKDHDLLLENTAYSGIYFINRNNEEREYFYDVTIPIKNK